MPSLSRLYKCRNYLQILGIVLFRIPNSRVRKIAAVRLREMKADGSSAKEICAELGISRASVYRVLETSKIWRAISHWFHWLMWPVISDSKWEKYEVERLPIWSGSVLVREVSSQRQIQEICSHWEIHCRHPATWLTLSYRSWLSANDDNSRHWSVCGFISWLAERTSG